ncbi:MAG: radical SAM protein [bacterium]
MRWVWLEMRCENCNNNFKNLSSVLRLCPDCIKGDFDKLKPKIDEVHIKSRSEFNLPPFPPRDKEGVRCSLCANECQIKEGEFGYCKLRKNENGSLIHLGGTKEIGLLEWYYDPLPTNCVACWVCNGNKEIGYNNLAVFYTSCTFNCLFCQNWHYRKMAGHRMSARELAELVNDKTACICYFGGDPAPQMIHSISSAKIVHKANKKIRICWETNGSMNKELLKEAANLSLESNGCIKFDLKAYNENLHYALCGTSNKRTLENFNFLSTLIKKRPSPPFLVASTLLVPGYVGVSEVRDIASFIATCNPDIPYSLLAFYPHFYMNDLPTTSRKEAEDSLKTSFNAGLKKVKIGNIHLLRT